MQHLFNMETLYIPLWFSQKKFQPLKTEFIWKKKKTCRIKYQKKSTVECGKFWRPMAVWSRNLNNVVWIFLIYIRLKNCTKLFNMLKYALKLAHQTGQNCPNMFLKKKKNCQNSYILSLACSIIRNSKSKVFPNCLHLFLFSRLQTSIDENVTYFCAN